MKLVVYRCRDRRLLVARASLSNPSALSREGGMERVGVAFIAAANLSLAVDLGLAVDGYGVADDLDAILINASLVLDR